MSILTLKDTAFSRFILTERFTDLASPSSSKFLQSLFSFFFHLASNFSCNKLTMPLRSNRRPRANSQDPVRDVANIIRSPTTVEDQYERSNLVYLFEVTLRGSRKKVYKIGKTHKTMAERENGIKDKCQHDIMEPVTGLSFQHTCHAALAEALFKAEFRLQREEFNCPCGTQHTEYFDISHDVAVEALIRWRDFCAKRPWDLETGKLLPFWDNRLQVWEHGFATAGRQDQKAIAASWRRFTEPTVWAYAWFDGRDIVGPFCVACLLLVLAIRGLQNPSTVSLELVVCFLFVFIGLMCYSSTLHTMQFLCANSSSWFCAGLQDRSAATISNAASDGRMEEMRAVTPTPLIGAYPDDDVEVVSVQELGPSERSTSPVVWVIIDEEDENDRK